MCTDKVFTWLCKIKVGSFAKDGLDMSAIREVKFLQELKHPNVIEVSPYTFRREGLTNAKSYWMSFLPSLT